MGTTIPDPKLGQIWQDKRSTSGRQVKIVDVFDGKVTTEPTNYERQPMRSTAKLSSFCKDYRFVRGAE